MEDERDTTQEPPQSSGEPTETSDAHNDNPPVSDDAGQKGAGTATGALGGLEDGSEPSDEDARDHERP